MLRPSIYRKAIMEACEVDAKEASLIEEVMRASYPTLDHLDSRSFNRIAREAKKALNDPELQKLYERG